VQKSDRAERPRLIGGRSAFGARYDEDRHVGTFGVKQRNPRIAGGAGHFEIEQD
jgi:hypothetical protein